jgi:hypothetical protein
MLQRPSAPRKYLKHPELLCKLLYLMPSYLVALSRPFAGPKAGPGGFTVKAPARSSAAANGTAAGAKEHEEEEGSDWETASGSDVEEGQQEDSDMEWEDWDPCVSFFDNKVCTCRCQMSGCSLSSRGCAAAAA